VKKIFIYLIMALFAIILMLAPFCIKAQTTINGAVVSLVNGGQIVTISNDSALSLTTAYLAVNMCGPGNGYIGVSFTLYRNGYAYTNKINSNASNLQTTYFFSMPAPDGIPDFALSYSKPLILAYLAAQGFTVKSTF
jgi:hypothetical protein